jgi:hypothetical protein
MQIIAKQFLILPSGRHAAVAARPRLGITEVLAPRRICDEGVDYSRFRAPAAG